jgi:hypothetical protein
MRHVPYAEYEIHIQHFSRKLWKEEANLEDPFVDRRIILNWILKTTVFINVNMIHLVCENRVQCEIL